MYLARLRQIVDMTTVVEHTRHARPLMNFYAFDV